MPHSSPCSVRRSDGWWALGLALLTAAIYAPALGYEFVELDDKIYIVSRVEIQHGIDWNTLKFIATRSVAANWHPLTMLSHAIDCSLFGLNPSGHHASSVFWHAISAALAFLTLVALTGNRGASLAAAAIFALHPLRVESVAWVSERKDVLSGALGLGCLWAYACWTQRGGGGRYALVCVLLGLGLMAKPMLVTWPCVMLLLDYWPLGRIAQRDSSQPAWRSAVALIVEKIPLFALVGFGAAMTFHYQRNAGAMAQVATMGPRVSNAIQSYGAYVFKLFWPLELYIPYAMESRDLRWSTTMWPALALVGVSLAAAFFWRRAPQLVVGWLWFLGTLAPVIGIVKVGSQAMADRYTYLPHLGLLLMVVWTVAAWVGERRWPRRAAAAAAALIVAALAVQTIRQLPHWRNSATLFGHTLACDSENFSALSVMGKLKLDEGDLDEAQTYLERSLKSMQTGEAVMALGEVALRRMHLEEAMYLLRMAAVSLAPDPRSNALMYLADAMSLLGGREQAILCYNEALRLEPNLAVRHPEFARQLTQNDRQFDLLKRLREAHSKNPHDALVAGRLAWIYSTSENPAARDPAKAVGLARQAANASQRQDPHMLDVLAAALADAGQFSEAERTSQQAEALCRELAEETPAWTTVAEQIVERRMLYAQRKAYRENPKDGQRLFVPLYPKPRFHETEHGYRFE